jgi:imidazolonepropionase-like amidohydrolase
VTRSAIRAPLAWLGPGRVATDVTVTYEAGSIVGVSSAETPEPSPGIDREIVADGFLMPAGADRHVHIGLSDPQAILRRGITAVRDLAWPADDIFPLAELSESPSFRGPLIQASGPMITAGGGYPTAAAWAPDGTGWEVFGPDDAAETVRDLAARGAAVIKVSLNAEAGPTPSDAELAAICESAHAAALKVTAHAQGIGQVERALGARVDELAHTPWTRVSDDVVRLCASSVRVVSTLDILSFGRRTRELGVALDNLGRFVAAGGEVVYGTDLGNGAIPAGIHTHELELLHEAGLTPDQVLGSLVRAPIQPGAPADLIVLGADPREDLGAFGDVRLVVRAGAVV